MMAVTLILRSPVAVLFSASGTIALSNGKLLHGNSLAFPNPPFKLTLAASPFTAIGYFKNLLAQIFGDHFRNDFLNTPMQIAHLKTHRGSCGCLAPITSG